MNAHSGRRWGGGSWRRRAGCLHGLAATFVLVALARAQDAPDTAGVSVSPSSQPTTAAVVAKAIDELADPRWRTRRQAGYTLLDVGEPCLPALRQAYQQTSRYEMRLRIRELAESIFARRFTRQLGGFLGVAQRVRLARSDPRIPAGTAWIEIDRVLRDTAADRAGLRAGDLVISCAGREFSDDQPQNEFVKIIQSHQPGQTMELAIIRGDGPPLHVTVRLGCRPTSALSGADPDVYAHSMQAFEQWWQGGEAVPLPDDRASTTQPSTTDEQP